MTATAVRPNWHDLPVPTREAVVSLAGADVTAAESQGGGYTPGLATRLHLADGSRLFVKGIECGHPLSGTYRAEAELTAALPNAAPTPGLRWTVHTGGWIVLAMDDIPGTTPDLAPGSPDLPAVVTAVTALGATLTPSPVPDAPTVADALGPVLQGWTRLADDTDADELDLDPWAAAHLGKLAGVERGWLDHAAGTTLVHGDLRADNLIVRAEDGTVAVVDWSYPHQGAAWIDAAALVPHLILAGHTPDAAEKVVADIPAWRAAPAEALDAFAVACTGYWTRSARLAPPPGVPYLRGFQARAAAAGLAWTRHRTGWT
ncbi:MAG: phosphotransferase [Streptomycetaceae bacterium]|nr:phosphotransferase [Streptomycetaceae bacterium]